MDISDGSRFNHGLEGDSYPRPFSSSGAVRRSFVAFGISLALLVSYKLIRNAAGEEQIQLQDKTQFRLWCARLMVACVLLWGWSSASC